MMLRSGSCLCSDGQPVSTGVSAAQLTVCLVCCRLARAFEIRLAMKGDVKMKTAVSSGSTSSFEIFHWISLSRSPSLGYEEVAVGRKCVLGRDGSLDEQDWLGSFDFQAVTFSLG
ncbi:hypothetical protein GGR57DRAFT_463935 [Xylariaceae sp. FL1272]|nr:hypothetical protein GGR57DRAFT_463935 [Xylariaceae sp. FL1272]